MNDFIYDHVFLAAAIWLSICILLFAALVGLAMTRHRNRETMRRRRIEERHDEVFDDFLRF